MKWLPIVLVLVAIRLALIALHVESSDMPWIEAGHRHDSGWYQKIALNGYPADPKDLGEPYVQTEWAFFPLYPLLIRATMSVGFSDPVLAMEVLSWPLMILAVIGFAGLSRRLLSERTAHFALLLFVCFPFSIFLHVHYSEALFLSLLFASFNAIHDRRSVVASFLLAALVLVRPSGLFMLPPALLFHMERSGHLFSDPRHYHRSLWIAIPAVICFSAYTFFQFQMTGDPFAFSSAQAGWGRRLSWPWESFFSSGDIATQIESIYTILLIPFAIFLLKDQPRSFQLLVLINILMPLLSGSVDSMTRFTLVMFPLFLGLAEKIGSWKRPWPVLAIMLFLQTICVWLWSKGHMLMA